VSLDHLWAGWRSGYIARAAAGATDQPEGQQCVMCRLVAAPPEDPEAHVVWRGPGVTAALNAYPYTSGHLMVMPERHVGDLEDLQPEESARLWSAITAAVVAVKAAYRPDGVNAGMNLGRAAGAGIPGHLHVPVLPRWAADTNFMTSVAEARVLPEALGVSWQKLKRVWP
jgi:diadenosine tetraphosphate (Ap4A) HIT family hydrolase